LGKSRVPSKNRQKHRKRVIFGKTRVSKKRVKNTIFACFWDFGRFRENLDFGRILGFSGLFGIFTDPKNLAKMSLFGQNWVRTQNPQNVTFWAFWGSKSQKPSIFRHPLNKAN
jgi:hypothetical protein